MSTQDAPSAWKIEQAMSAWQAARARLLMDDADLANDEAALAALLGPAEGDVDDILARLLRASVHARDMADAAGERIDAITIRRDRYKRRAEAMRGTVFAIMDALGRRKVELPDMTASIAAGRPSLVITDEAALPAGFVRTKTEPDKTAILTALKTDAEVPGATLSNNLPTLQVRTR